MNNPNIFEIIPHHFFSILSSPNQVIYSDCLFLMYHFLEKGNSFGDKKETIIELLSDYFLDSTSYIEDITCVTPRDKAIYTLRRLKECGWIFEEEDAHYEMLINFSYYAIPILKTLYELKKSDYLEYLGYIFLIYSALKNIELDSLCDILDQIYYNTNVIMNRLKSLNANIKTYIQNLLNKKAIQDLKSIVENLFIDYKKNIIDNHYQRLKTSDNVSKYRPYIISKLNEISLNDDIIKEASLALVNKNQFTDIMKAKEHIYDQIDYIISSFENLDQIMKEIDKKNTKYIHTSISKIQFIVSNTQDLQGKINKILSHWIKNNVNKEMAIFRLFPKKYLDSKSIYTMPSRESDITPQMIMKEKFLSYEEKQIHFMKILESNLYNKDKINHYVINFLKNKEKFNASSLPLTNYEDYTKLILIYMYSDNDVQYKVHPLNEVYQNDGYIFYDFEIMRK